MSEAGRGSFGWLRWLPVVLIVLGSLTVLVTGAAKLVDLDTLLASRASLHALVAEDRTRAIAVAFFAYLCAVIVSVPASLVLTAFCGFLFGPVTGAILAVCAATTAAAIVFGIGRNAARDLILKRAGSKLARFAESFRKDSFGYIVFLRVVPICPFWLTNLAPAAFGVRPRTFVLATFLGLAPGAFVYAAIGAGIEEAIAIDEATKASCLAAGEGTCDTRFSLRDMITPTMLAGLGSFAAVALFSAALRRRLERRAAGA